MGADGRAEVPAGELTAANAKKAMEAYRAKHIDTSSPVPLYHVMGYGFVASYCLSWPWEYAHMQHGEALAKGGHHHLAGRPSPSGYSSCFSRGCRNAAYTT